MSYRKKMTYRRAVWDANNPNDLEQIVIGAITGGNRVMAHREFEIKALRIRHIAGEPGVFLHLANYEPDQPVSIIPHRGEEPGQQNPPAANDYLRSDMAVMIRENHVLILASGLREVVLHRWLRNFLNDVVEPQLLQFALKPITNINLAREIRTKGVKSVRLNTTTASATASYEQGRVGEDEGFASRTLKKFLGSARFMDLAEFDEAERRSIVNSDHIHVELVISLRHKRSEIEEVELERTAIERIAQNMVEADDLEGDDDFELVLGNNDTVRANQLRLHKFVNVNKLGSSFEQNDAWDKLSQYYDELNRNGRLQQ